MWVPCLWGFVFLFCSWCCSAQSPSIRNNTNSTTPNDVKDTSDGTLSTTIVIVISVLCGVFGSLCACLVVIRFCCRTKEQNARSKKIWFRPEPKRKVVLAWLEPQKLHDGHSLSDIRASPMMGASPKRGVRPVDDDADSPAPNKKERTGRFCTLCVEAECLSYTNSTRKRHGACQLAWSPDLYDAAREELNAMISGQPPPLPLRSGCLRATIPNEKETMKQILELWYTTGMKAYNFNSAPSIQTPSPEIIRFAQLLWCRTTVMAAAFSRNHGKSYFVALFDPPGSVMGHFPGNVLPYGTKSPEIEDSDDGSPTQRKSLKARFQLPSTSDDDGNNGHRGSSGRPSNPFALTADNLNSCSDNVGEDANPPCKYSSPTTPLDNNDNDVEAEPEPKAQPSKLSSRNLAIFGNGGATTMGPTDSVQVVAPSSTTVGANKGIIMNFISTPPPMASSESPCRPPTPRARLVPVSQSLRVAILAKINTFRRDHNSPEVTWDDSERCSALAQDIALSQAQGVPSAVRNPIVMSGTTAGRLGDDAAVAVSFVLSQWYEEAEQLKECVEGSAALLLSKAPNFTQLIWKSSKVVGVGMAQALDSDAVHIVCAMDPPRCDATNWSKSDEAVVVENVQMHKSNKNVSARIMSTVPPLTNVSRQHSASEEPSEEDVGAVQRRRSKTKREKKRSTKSPTTPSDATNEYPLGNSSTSLGEDIGDGEHNMMNIIHNSIKEENSGMLTTGLSGSSGEHS
eukprot:PhM_4_TR14111/c0_g1_i1/m.43058